MAPMPSPTEPRPMATFAHAVPLDWMPCSASLASTCLSISRADPLDQPLGHGPVVRSAKFGMHGCRRSDVLVRPLVHKTKLYRD